MENPALPKVDSSDRLSSILPSPRDSYDALAHLSNVLASQTEPWPVLDLQQTYLRCWKQLPEAAKAGRASPEEQQVIDQTLIKCKQTYSSLLDLLHRDSHTSAIIDPDTGASLSHHDLSAFLNNFKLPLSDTKAIRKPVVAISLPNGPLLALTVFATAVYWTAAPLAHGIGVGAEQFKNEALQAKVKVVISQEADVDRLDLRGPWVAEADITVVLVDLGRGMRLTMKDVEGNALPMDAGTSKPIPNAADDTGILLFTSGTSGTKKLVPVSIHSMVCGIAMVVDSWGLSPSMRCLNQMPLHHVGGLIRNLFAPIISGGSVICCNAFDANLFWDCVESYSPTWYYASPSMHQNILEAGKDRPESLARSEIRLVCNAAGGLLPNLACLIRDTFSTSSKTCIVLPSYGMTECMPISTPPLTYQLEKTGTSGISVGPEIIIQDGNGACAVSGNIGRICVRGQPLFSGYLRSDNSIDKSCFDHNGWFDTGDMGYMDREGYLYITGRSKEVINRGGELISPFEVEEAIISAAKDPASPTYEQVSQALAFSVDHDVLQEVVGICIVTAPGRKRPCLRNLQMSVKASLSQVKVPVLVVYMDTGVPTSNNKVLRIRLAQRLALPEVSDATPLAERYYEAACPPPNTPLSQAIECKQLQISDHDLITMCSAALNDCIDFHLYRPELYPEIVLAPRQGFETTVSMPSPIDLQGKLSKTLHGYDVPSKIYLLYEPLPRTEEGAIDETALAAIITNCAQGNSDIELSRTEYAVAEMFSDLLRIPLGALSGSSDFFECGGDSLKAGRLLFLCRQRFGLRFAVNLLFTNSAISDLAAVVDEKLLSLAPTLVDSSTNSLSPVPQATECERTCSSTNPLLLFVQLIPIFVLHPMRRALTWTIFMYCLAYSQYIVTNNYIPGRLLDLVVSMFIGRTVTRCTVPFVAIALKWAIIGRYREGIYPMWGLYHTRWWLTQKIICIGGMGIFGVNNWSRTLYYRLLGARIGKNVTISKGATLGEYDLLDIGNDVVLERCICRPFGAEANTSMYLGRIIIGANSSIGLSAIVAPGSNLAPNTCLGPNSSSWEAADADESNRDLAASRIQGSHWLFSIFAGVPLKFFAQFARGIP